MISIRTVGNVVAKVFITMLDVYASALVDGCSLLRNLDSSGAIKWYRSDRSLIRFLNMKEDEDSRAVKVGRVRLLCRLRDKRS
ncbi:hypothetical protein [Mucilaginibacter terrenus]|uniref:hypothetical protein n=1 Tax=Mucilaginibacter terrenus TaxID=2482727 RepID=UPI0010588AB6|nr:hypothetical protein [Mucilaginibacter terrenus]